MSSARRFLAPAIAGAAGTLGIAFVATAIVVGGKPDAISGFPEPGPMHPPPGAMPYRGSLGPSTLDTPGTPPPTTTTSASPTTRVTPRVQRGQAPGTILLAHGGTARLIREEVGADAVLPVPDNVNEATWWGTKIGADTGATVLAGHVNWRGATGPFAELWDSAIGDEVSVVDDSGTAWRYRVSRVVTVVKDELPQRAEELFGQDGPPRLVLVTCGGRWVGGAVGYASNQVVVATPMT